MKKLILFSWILTYSHLAIAQINITCQAYYLSTPNRNLPNVAVTAYSTSGAVLGSCNTGSSGQCVMSGGSTLLNASYQFNNGYVINKRLTSGDTIVRAGFDESYVRESPTITKEIEDAPSSSYPTDFFQIGNYAYFRAFKPSDGFQVRRYNTLSNVHETISLPSSIQKGNVTKIWLAGTRVLVYADGQFYIITNPSTLTPSMSSALAGVPFLPNPEKSVFVGDDYLYFSSSLGLTELEVSTSTFRAIDVNLNANVDNLIYHPGTNFVYFTAANSSGQDRQLWRVLYGGYTPTKISNINSPIGAGINEIVNWNGRLYFTAETPAIGRELYRITATGAGVELFLDIITGSTSSNARNLTPAVSGALGQNELYLETHQYGLVRVSTTGVVNQVVDVTTGAMISATSKMTYSPTRGILYCKNESANAFYEHVFGEVNATNLTVSNAVDLYSDYNGLEMIPFGNGILFRGKKITNNDTYLGQISYMPFSYGGPTYWSRTVTTIHTFPNTLLASLFNQAKLDNLTVVGSRVYFSAIGSASRGFEPWYYNSTVSPNIIETPEVNTQPLGISNDNDMETVSYNNYLYFNAENYYESSLRNLSKVGFAESIQKTLGTQHTDYFDEMASIPDITSLKIAGTRLFTSSVHFFNTYIESKNLATNDLSTSVTADIRSFDNASSIGNTLYFLSLPRGVSGMSFRKLWRTDGTAAGTYTIDTENTTYTGTYAWNGGIFYAKNDGSVIGGVYRYDHATGATSTLSPNAMFISSFTEFGGSLYFRTSSGSGLGALRKTDGATFNNVVVAGYAYVDVQVKLIGNRLVVAVKSVTTGNWNIRSTTDGTNFTEHFSSIADLTLIGGANGILLGAVGTSSRHLVQYNLNNNTSSIMGTGAFYTINIFPAIDDTNPAATLFYFALEPTNTSGYRLYSTTLTTAGASTLTAIGASWVEVINRKNIPWLTLYRVGRKVFFLGQDVDKSRGIELWVYNPDRCANALTLASYDDDEKTYSVGSEPKRNIQLIANTTIQATNDILANNADVLYRAGQSVTLLPGFQIDIWGPSPYIPVVGIGSFEVQVGGCGTLIPR